MFSIKGRLQSKQEVDRFNGMLFIAYLLLILAMIGYVTYKFLAHGNEPFLSNIEKGFLLVTAFFVITTFRANTDYVNINKTHKHTLDYYIADLNPSKGSLLFNAIEKEGFFCFGTIMLSVCIILFSLVVIVKTLFLCEYPCAGLFSYNLFLMLVSILFGGLDISYSKVTSEKLNEIDQVENLTEKSKKKFREEVLRILDKDKSVNRSDVLKICLALKKDVIKMESEKENVDAYADFRTESLKKGIQ